MAKYLPKISIIVPVYNAENCLHFGLDSILQQTYKYFEVILVNDGSTDNSGIICKEYVEKDSRFRLFNQKNSGVAEARNCALSASNGEYITFMDSDDWVEKDWLETYVNALEQVRTDVLVQGFAVDAGLTIHREYVEDNIYEDAALFDAFQNLEKHGIEGYVTNKMYRASLIKQYKLKFRYMLHEDTLFNTEFFCYATSLITLSKVCYHYVQHKGGLVSRRYGFDYMMSLNTSLRDARLQMAEIYKREDYRDKFWAGYIGMYTILLFSLYDKNRGISSRKRRLSIWSNYQLERRKRRNLSLSYSTFGKLCFSYVAMLPPVLLDFLLKIFFTLK